MVAGAVTSLTVLRVVTVEVPTLCVLSPLRSVCTVLGISLLRCPDLVRTPASFPEENLLTIVVASRPCGLALFTFSLSYPLVLDGPLVVEDIEKCGLTLRSEFMSMNTRIWTEGR